MATQVSPEVARQGTFLESFPAKTNEVTEEVPPEVELCCARMERELARQKVAGEIVYTMVPNWGKKRGGTFQVFLL